MSSSAGINEPINFAKAFGFNSLAAAAVFVGLYVPLFALFVFKSFKIPTYVHYVLSFFCLIRIAAFTLRIVLTASESAGENIGILIADEILFGVGFFGLLYSAYTLVLDLESLSDRPSPTNPIIRLTQNRRMFRLTLLVAVVIGVVASSLSSGGSSDSTSSVLRKASTAIFLVLTVLQAFQTIYLAQTRISEPELYKRAQKSFGARHGIFILVLISFLLLIREVFVAATIDDHVKQNNEHFWYPLLVVPEILAVILYAIPGLVPSKEDLKGEELKGYGDMKMVAIHP
ncbi:hypothetical protein NLJ89_g8734 [Agrocybe chaxingu]|uniref:Uncharacterized protein n=1 Tax=Agrocybe chaxingu TaxID=84603 RepID=A0A9W8JS43_9AGAR|nr:hypothetical protein NLJ89_g8734 [Agrocybe chaxingu]